jgi:predicted nucleotidyltransferase
MVAWEGVAAIMALCVKLQTSVASGFVMHTLIEQRRAEIALLCRRYGVRRLEVFGSAARGSDFDPASSDADFLVDFEPGSDMPPLRQFFGLAEDLQALLGRSVDLVETGAIKNPFILADINRAREIVYAS